MKILIVTQWYDPVKGAAAKRTGKMARFLADAGHAVTVLTSLPSYPTGIVAPEYQGKLWDREKKDSFEIIRVWEIPASTQDSTLKRLFNMVTFTKSAFWAALILHPFDAVIVSSPSFLSGIPGLVAARDGGKFFFDVRDLWPDSAVELGVLAKDSFATKQLKKLEKKYYNRSTKIFTATPGIRDHLMTENIPAEKIEVLLNSVDTGLFQPGPGKFAEYGLNPDDFVCGYVGNMSRVYDLETVVRTAEILKANQKIKFMLIGEGETKRKLEEMTQRLGLSNVIFVPETKLNDLPPIINTFKVGLAPIANIGVSQESFPSKISEYFACAKPVLASLGGDMARIIKEHEAGLIYTPGAPEALAQIITDLTQNSEKTARLGQNAQKLAREMFSDETFKEKLLKAII